MCRGGWAPLCCFCYTVHGIRDIELQTSATQKEERGDRFNCLDPMLSKGLSYL